MKTASVHTRTVLSLSALALLITGAVLYAGPLDPPVGPVASTAKPLSEIEPRTAINAANTPGDADSLFKIITPGSYYLTGNIAGVVGKHGVEIAASGVTLDLNGFDLVGVAGSLDGVSATVNNLTNIAVVHGSVRNWGDVGVDLGSFVVANCRVEGVLASGNTGTGIFAGPGSAVTNCSAFQNIGNGISTSNGSTVSNCSAFQNSSNGFTTISGSTVVDCTARFNTVDGIVCASACVVRGNTCSFNGNGAGDGAGIHVVVSDNRIEGNTCTGADRGIEVEGGNNYISDNTVRSNTDNYDMVQGNHLNILLGQIPESIDWSANVTLAGSLTGVSGQNGITITANDVTIDLGGHALIGVAGSLDGVSIAVAGLTNIAVVNGSVRNWGDEGVDLGTLEVVNGRVEGVLASGNAGTGILTGAGCTITGCSAYVNGGGGIFTGAGCTVSNCSALQNTGTGIFASNGCAVSNCSASVNTATGISTGAGCTVSNCSAFLNTGTGIIVNTGSTVADCTAGRNVLDGIACSISCTIRGNTCSFNGNGAGDGAGIHATGGDNRIEGNNCTSADRGIGVDLAGNVIIKNTCGNNALNWNVVAGNVILVVQAATAGIVAGNAGGTAPGSTDPNANFTY